MSAAPIRLAFRDVQGWMHLIDARLSTKEKKTWYKICQDSPHGAGIHVRVGLEGEYWVKDEFGMYRQDCPTVLIPFESFLGPSKVSSRLLNFIQSLLKRRCNADAFLI